MKNVFRVIALMLFDALIIAFSVFFAAFLRFDCNIHQIPQDIIHSFFVIPYQIVFTWLVFFLFRMYHFIWRRVSARDIVRIFLVAVCTCAVFYLVTILAGVGIPRSIVLMSFFLTVALQVAARSAMRIVSLVESYSSRRQNKKVANVLLFGCGEAGQMLAKEMLYHNNDDGLKLRCILDDDDQFWGRTLEGFTVLGGREKLAEAVKKGRIDEIILAIPSATSQTRKELLTICQQTGCRVRTLPPILSLTKESVTMANVQDVQMEDLLGREPIKLDTALVRNFISGKTVLVTGGGGSIGSELCRQIAKYAPRKLIILDIYENNAYDIQQELRQNYGAALDLEVQIASVRDKVQIYAIFDALKPDVVFHAAAHKHVPLMENCPQEAVKNNIFGTYHVVRAAERSGVKKFVMISTDKAVNPTNFMGATKRFCEMILQSRPEGKTEFCAVRFGNVLGSNGSVVPLFKRQIEEGGPVTITDKRIIRYFMTIPEAAQLVIEAGAMAHSRQIFVLDMGEPVKILELAENLIRLSGLTPYKDIEIKEIGLRPGEKLYEELLILDNNLSKTQNAKIFVEQQGELSPAEIMANLELLDKAVTEQIGAEDMIKLLRAVVPTYRDPDEVNAEVAAKHETEKVPG